MINEALKRGEIKKGGTLVEATSGNTGIALAFIFVFRRHLELHRNSLQFVFGAIAGGIAGNLGDRIFRNPAAVVDFIDVFLPWVDYDYPIFNVADSAIFIGAFSYLIIGFLDSKTKDDGQKNTSV